MEEVIARKPMHTDSSGHLPGSQLNLVQYPPGWVRSQSRSEVSEQSLSTSHLSPILGSQARTERRDRSSREGLNQRSMGAILSLQRDPYPSLSRSLAPRLPLT